MSTSTTEPPDTTDTSTPPTTRPSWYTPTPTIPASAYSLLSQYSNIPAAEIPTHVQRIRDKAFSIFQYACIGQGRFLNYSLPTLPYYNAVLSKLRVGATFLDVGCCFGSELRYLIHNEGVDPKQLFGFDLESDFIGFGHELFRDRDRVGATLAAGNLLAGRNEPGAKNLIALEGRMDVVHVTSVLHVWDWEDMLRAAKRLVDFARPVRGSLIVGNQMGSVNAGSYPMPVSTGSNYRHNEESMRRFWEQVGSETGTQWETSCGLYMSEAIKANQNASFADPGMRMIWFVVERV